METVTSSDGTRIAFRRSGNGPPLVLVHGSTADHSRWDTISPQLEETFTVCAMDRRGRGGSGDAETYALELECADVVAVVRAAGRRVSLLGHSFGALCAMEAALRLDNLRRLVLYEPAFPVGGAPLYPPGLPERYRDMLATGDREGTLTTFLREIAGASDDQIAAMRADPSWAGRVESVHTAVREMVDGDYRFEAERFRGLDVPVLLLTGEHSPAELRSPTNALHDALPDSRIVVLAGQGHIAMRTAPELFLDALMSFLAR